MSKKKYTKAEMKEYARDLFKQNVGEFAEETYQMFLAKLPPGLKEVSDIMREGNKEIRQILTFDFDESQDLFELACEYLEMNTGKDSFSKITLMQDIKNFGLENGLVIPEEPMVTILFEDGIVVHIPADEKDNYTDHIEITPGTTITDIQNYVGSSYFNIALENLKLK